MASLVYEEELVADDTFCGYRDYRVGSHQNVQALFNTQLDSELRQRPVRNSDIDDFSRIHACDPHLGALCDAIQILEFGINVEMARKSLVLIADQERDDCHSPRADGSGAWVLDGAIPDLRYMPAQVHDEFLGIVLAGTHRDSGMPGFGAGAGWPMTETKMSVDDANALHAYIIDLSWKAYNDDQAKLHKER